MLEITSIRNRKKNQRYIIFSSCTTSNKFEIKIMNDPISENLPQKEQSKLLEQPAPFHTICPILVGVGG